MITVLALLQNVIKVHLGSDLDMGTDEDSDSFAGSDEGAGDILAGNSDIRGSGAEIDNIEITPKWAVVSGECETKDF